MKRCQFSKNVLQLRLCWHLNAFTVFSNWKTVRQKRVDFDILFPQRSPQIFPHIFGKKFHARHSALWCEWDRLFSLHDWLLCFASYMKKRVPSSWADRYSHNTAVLYNIFSLRSFVSHQEKQFLRTCLVGWSWWSAPAKLDLESTPWVFDRFTAWYFN